MTTPPTELQVAIDVLEGYGLSFLARCARIGLSEDLETLLPKLADRLIECPLCDSGHTYIHAPWCHYAIVMRQVDPTFAELELDSAWVEAKFYNRRRNAALKASAASAEARRRRAAGEDVPVKYRRRRRR